MAEHSGSIYAGGIRRTDGNQVPGCKECTIHRTYKDKILASKDIDTMTTGKRLGHPVRALKTTVYRAFQK